MTITILEPEEAAAVEYARECLYRFFAAALSDPGGPGWVPITHPDDLGLAASAAGLIRLEAADDPVPLGLGERPPDDLDLAPVLAELRRPREELCAEYTRVFGLVSVRECPPYETEYCPTEEPFHRAQQLADVAGFYAAFGLTSAHARPDRPDHLALELEFLAYLLFKQHLAEADAAAGCERAVICADAARRFFRDHVAWWVPSCAAGLARKAGGGLYAALSVALAAFLPTERARFGVPAPKAPARPSPARRPEDEPEGCAGCPASA